MRTSMKAWQSATATVVLCISSVVYSPDASAVKVVSGPTKSRRHILISVTRYIEWKPSLTNSSPIVHPAFNIPGIDPAQRRLLTTFFSLDQRLSPVWHVRVFADMSALLATHPML